jgi:hypothetical protein
MEALAREGRVDPDCREPLGVVGGVLPPTLAHGKVISDLGGDRRNFDCSVLIGFGRHTARAPLSAGHLHLTRRSRLA